MKDAVHVDDRDVNVRILLKQNVSGKTLFGLNSCGSG